jgi:hypothetical protein
MKQNIKPEQQRLYGCPIKNNNSTDQSQQKESTHHIALLPGFAPDPMFWPPVARRFEFKFPAS